MESSQITDRSSRSRLLLAGFLLLCAGLALAAAAAQATPTLTPLQPNVTDIRTAWPVIAIQAQVSPANSTVLVDGSPESPDADGNVSTLLMLSAETTIVNFTAIDWMGERATLLYTVVLDQTAPQVTLSPLEDETLTNQPTLDVQAQMNEHGTARLNGVNMSTLDGFNFTFNMTLADGLNVLYFNFTDDVGNTVVVVRQVTYDRFPPFLQVTSPTDGLLVNYTQMTVEGRTEVSASVTVNGAPASVSPVDGTFNFSLTLDDLFARTENIITVRALDRAGNVAFENRSVFVDTQAPAIYIDLPPDFMQRIEAGLPISAQELSLRGTTDSGDASITVNGQPATIIGLSWNLTVALQEGLNQLVIVTVDDAGNHRFLVMFVTSDTVNPVLDVRSPNSTVMKTNQMSLHLAGRVTGEDSVTVRIIYVDPRGVQNMDPLVTTPEQDGSFSFAYDFGPLNSDVNAHTVEIQAVDAAGNMHSFVFEYTCKVGTPFLDVVGFRETVEAPFVWVNGTSEAGISTVRINGQEFEIAEQFFAVPWALGLPGNYTITVELEDDFGNIHSQTFAVHYKLPAQVPSSLGLLINASTNLTVAANTSRVFSLSESLPNELGVTWWLDGTIASYDRSITLSLDPGVHNVTVVVSNVTVSRTFTFTVNATAPAAGPTTPSPPPKPTPAAGGALVIAAISAGALAAAAAMGRRARKGQ